MSNGIAKQRTDDEVLLSFSRAKWLNWCNNKRLEWLGEFRALLHNGHAEILGFDDETVHLIDADYFELKALVELEKGAIILGKVSDLANINRRSENLLQMIDDSDGVEFF